MSKLQHRRRCTPLDPHRRYTGGTMQVRWRKNPKTEDGWFKRTAISLLAALAAFTISLPIGFFLYLNHLQNTFPNDTQNMLGAITSAVLTSLAVGGICFGGCMAIFLLFTLRAQPAKP